MALNYFTQASVYTFTQVFQKSWLQKSITEI